MHDNSQPFFRPYILMLKEGEEIENNFLDYNLVMLHVGSNERLQSPKTTGKAELVRPVLEMMPKGSPQILSANDPLF